MVKCPKISMATGTPCDLEEGHEGSHAKTYTNHDGSQYTARWSEKADQHFIDHESRKKLGT